MLLGYLCVQSGEGGCGYFVEGVFNGYLQEWSIVQGSDAMNWAGSN